MRLGANAIDAIRLGSSEVTAAYLGSDLVWTSADPEFILQMQTTTASESITLPMTTSVDVDIDWGDGSAVEAFNTNSPSHVYAAAGVYDIKITGTCGAFSFNQAGDRLKLLHVLNGGTDFVAGSWSSGFYGCENLATANFAGMSTPAPTSMFRMFLNCVALTSVTGFGSATCTSAASMLQGCTNLVSVDAPGLVTATTTAISSMFYLSPALESVDVSGWDTSNVTSISRVFAGCTSLAAADVSGWNTANVVDMSELFSGCASLTSIDLSGFNTSKVTNMFRMFSGCTGLTSLDASGFNTSLVTNMGSLFNGCSGLTSDPGIHTFNVTALTTATIMCSGANAMLSETEYNTILVNWEAQAVQNNVAVHFGDAKYSGAGATARAALVLPVLDGGHGWTITDGGAA